MNFITPFAPHYGSTKTVAPAAAAASASISVASQDKQVRLLNTGANIAYVRIGNSANGAVVASAADFPVAAGASMIISKSVLDDTLAYISPAGSTLVISTGNGV